MKKALFFAAVAAMGLSACADQNLGGKDGNGNGIEFRTLADKGGSRAAVTTDATISSFMVTGWWDKTATSSNPGQNLYGDANRDNGEYLFNGENISRSGAASWAYSPVRYWPSYGDVDFFAYSPATSLNLTKTLRNLGKDDGVNPAGDDKLITYEVPRVSENGKQQEDFLVAVSLDQTSTSDPGGRVSLQFLHALSRVKFNAVKVRDNVDYKIAGIRLVNLKSTGSLDLTALDGAASVFPSVGGFTYTAGSPLTLWDVTGSPVIGNVVNNRTSGYAVDFGQSPVTVLYNNDPVLVYSPVIGVTNAMMVMPQTTTLGEVYTAQDVANNVVTGDKISTPKAGKESDFYIVVSYSASQGEGDNLTYIAGGAGADNQKDTADDVFAEKYIPVKVEYPAASNIFIPLSFEIGRQYTFNLTFGEGDTGDEMVEIAFSVDVEDWDKTNVEQ